MADQQKALTGVDLDTLVPDPNAIDQTMIANPIAAWPGASDNVIVSAKNVDGTAIVQRGHNNGEPGIVWSRSMPVDGDWSDWQQIEPIPDAEPKEHSNERQEI